MDENNDNESEDLRRALERLASSARGARSAFEQLARALEDFTRHLDQEAWESYVRHGSPFGKSDEGLGIWFEFEQYTTVN